MNNKARASRFGPHHHAAMPTWSDVSAEASDGAPLNPLEQFILDHEPAGERDIKWRDQLAAVIEWVKQ